MNDQSLVNRFLSRPLVDAYLHFCLYAFVGGLVIFIGIAALIVIRVWLGFSPFPDSADPINSVTLLLVAVFVTILIAFFFALKRFRGIRG